MQPNVKRDMTFPVSEVVQKLHDIDWWNEFKCDFTISNDGNFIQKTNLDFDLNCRNEKKVNFKK